MAIQAIRQTMPRANAINFEGKKDKTPKHQPASSPMYKSVPLAVLIAMSPIVSSSRGNDTSITQPITTTQIMSDNPTETILATKTFKQIEPGIDLKVDLVDRDNKKNVRFTYIDLEHGNDVTEDNKLVNYNFSIVSDDGSKKSFKLNRIHSFLKDENPSPYVEPAPIIINNKGLIDYLNKIKKQYPDAIKTETYDRTLSINPSGTYLRNNAEGDIMKKAQAKESYGKNVGSQDFEGDNGKYTFAYYSTDGNENNLEVVTVKKEGYPELKVQNALYQECVFGAGTKNATSIKYGQVQLVDANNKTYNIIDNALAEAVDMIKTSLSEQNAFNNAYPVLSFSNKYGETPKGAIYAID